MKESSFCPFFANAVHSAVPKSEILSIHSSPLIFSLYNFVLNIKTQTLGAAVAQQSSSDGRISGTIPDPCSQGVEVFLGEILNPK